MRQLKILIGTSFVPWHNQQMNILINRTDAIGDTILTLPIVDVLKRNIPNCRIGFLVSEKAAPLLKNNPNIDEFWVFDDKQGWFSRILFLQSLFQDFKADTYLYIGGSHLPSFFSFLQGIKNRGGLVSRWPSFVFLNKGVRQYRSKAEKHEVEYNIELLKPLGIKQTSLEKNCQLVFLQKEEEKKFEKDLVKYFPDVQLPKEKETIVIHPGMTGHTLNWPGKFYGQLVQRIEETCPGKFQFVISFTPSDQKYVDEMLSGLDSKVKVYLVNGLSLGLRGYLAFLQHIKLFIGPSTGPTHLADIMRAKVLAFYSPLSVQSAKRWGPLGQNQSRVKVLTPKLDVNHEDIMSEISVDLALDASLELL